MKQIPFLPISFSSSNEFLRPVEPFITTLALFFPSLEDELEQIESRVTAKVYLGGSVLSSSIFFVMISGILLFILATARPLLLADFNNVLIILASSGFFSVFVFGYSLLLPKWKAQKKIGAIEKDLLFAIRHLTVQTNAGVPLFRALVSVSEQRGALGYGAISTEFSKIVKDVKGGKSLSQALDESARKNPSRYYERIMWQLANSNRAGVPVNKALKELLDYLTGEQKIALQNYGAQLSPLALMYMLTAIVGPTLGLIFLMIMSTLVDIPVNEVVFGAILVILTLIQMFFLGLIRSRRPTVSM